MGETALGNSVPAKRTDKFTVFLSVVSLALAVLVVLLAVQNRKLKQELSGQGGPPPGTLAQGDKLEPFTVVDPAGTPVSFQFNGAPRLVLAFTSTCPHCLKTFPVWRDVLQQGTSGLEVVGIQLDAGAKEGAAARLDTLPFPVYVPGEPAPAFVSKLYGVPTTLVVDGDGTVRRVWYGAITEENVGELKTALGEAAAHRTAG